MGWPVISAPFSSPAGTTNVTGSMAQRYQKYPPRVGPCPTSKTTVYSIPIDRILPFLLIEPPHSNELKPVLVQWAEQAEIETRQCDGNP